MTQNIIQKYNIRAKKSLWQNFLVNEGILNNIVDIININWKNIVEVWPGYWALTEKIVHKNPKSLSLVELDKDMIEILEDRVSSSDLYIGDIDFKINNIDVLKYEPTFNNYSLIANIPYYITSPIIRHFLYDIEKSPEKMLILMQKEVWEKILLKWKNKSSVLSLFVQKKSIAKKVIDVYKTDFIPAPKVDSIVLLFEHTDKYNYVDDDNFLKIIKIWFSSARKKLLKNLVNWNYNKEDILNIFERLWIDKNCRGEDLDIEVWCSLVEEIILLD